MSGDSETAVRKASKPRISAPSGSVAAAVGAERRLGLAQDPLLLAVEHRGEELVLGGEAVVDDRLRDARRRGDRVHRGALEAVGEEEVVGGVEHQRPPALGPKVRGALSRGRGSSGARPFLLMVAFSYSQ